MTQPTAQSDYSRAYAQAAALYAGARTRPQPTEELGVTSTAAAAAVLAVILATRPRLYERWRVIDPYDDAEVEAFAADAGRITVPAQRAAARATAAAQTQMMRSLGIPVTVTPTVPDDVRSATLSGDLERRAAARVAYAPKRSGDAPVVRMVQQADSDTGRVFTRAAVTYRFRRSEGATDTQAQAAAQQRIDSILDGNLQIARRLAEHQALQQARAIDLDRPIVGYRRIIHPEMSVGGVCGLCIAAADRTYKWGKLKAIHAGCWCTVLPKFGDYDPGYELNRQDLDTLYAAAGGNTNEKLKRTRYEVEEHAELGPMLVPVRGGGAVPYYPVREEGAERPTLEAKPASGSAKSSPRKNSPAKETPREIALRHLPALRASLARLRAAGRPEDSSSVRYHLEQIAKFESYL